MAVSHSTAQQYPSRLSHERSELALSGSRHKAVCSPWFAQGQGPGLCPERKVTPRSRITALGHERGLHRSNRLPALLTLPTPSATCGNWDDLAKGQHLPWTQCWSILTELVLTVLSASQRASQKILHYKMCPWLLPPAFQCRFLSLNHACLHASTLSVFNCSSLLKYTSTEYKAKTTHSQILPEAPFTSPQHVLHT